MAINEKEFINKIDTGIKADKNYQKFFLYFRYKNKRYKKILDYSQKLWDKKTKIIKARNEVINIKDNADNPEKNEDRTLSAISKKNFSMLELTQWNKNKINFYSKYIATSKIHNMNIKDILHQDILELIDNYKKRLSPKTLKNFISILNPIFKESISNRYCIYNPCENIKIKVPKTKKIINNAKEKLKILINAIEEIYKNDDFYYCLFYFYIQGRRKSEVLKMKWENIDLEKEYYIIEETKNGENQKFILLKNIISRLKRMIKINKYVFPSNIKRNEHIINIRNAVNKINLYDKSLADFTLKDTRNIITSAMGENGENAIFQSGTLGHRSLKTIDKYSTVNYEMGSRKANKTIENQITL